MKIKKEKLKNIYINLLVYAYKKLIIWIASGRKVAC